MKMLTINAYGYSVTGPARWIKEVLRHTTDPDRCWNWFNFEEGEVAWDDNGEYVGRAAVNHELKVIAFIP